MTPITAKFYDEHGKEIIKWEFFAETVIDEGMDSHIMKAIQAELTEHINLTKVK